MDKEDLKQAERILGATSHWNGGAGLIVPEVNAKHMREVGIIGHFTVAKNIGVITNPDE